GPGFWPTSPQGMQSVATTLTLEPAVSMLPTLSCPPLDPNRDNFRDGADLQQLVAAYITGPADPNFCAIDANANGVADLEDLAIAITVLLSWPSSVGPAGDWVNIKDTQCDFRRHALTVCQGSRRPPPYPAWAIRAADKNGNPSGCPVKFQMRNCDGIDIGTPVELEPGATGCIEVPEDRELVVWCKPTDGGQCRISVKSVKGCP